MTKLDKPDWEPSREDLKNMYELDIVLENGLTINCYFEYEEAEPEVGLGESITLCYALVDGLDITEVVDQDLQDRWCEQALESMENDKEDADYDRGADRYEDRRGV